jgi:Secretion system C-terminal sorting domain/Receptor L domain
MKKSLLFLIVLFFLFYCQLSAQSCLENGVTFSNQEQIDSFPLLNCTEIIGDVTISGDDIVNLDSLSLLISIIGNLKVQNSSSLTNFGGLDNLIFIGEDLSIIDNISLTSLNGLGNLTSIGKNISIGKNDALTSLSGLSNISSVTGSLRLYANESLASLNGLNNVTKVGDELNISYNTSLVDLIGLENLDSIEGAFLLASNDALNSLIGLENLSSVGFYTDECTEEYGLWISGNSSLTSLNGLENLEQIEGCFVLKNNIVLSDLYALNNLNSIGSCLIYFPNCNVINTIGLEINGNQVLTSLEGLNNLDLTSITRLKILGCSSLSFCEVQSICEFISNGGAAIINDNASGCNSLEEVETACLSPTEELIDNNIKIFPNPSRSIINIKGNNLENWNFSIWNTVGMQLKNQQIPDYGQIDLSLFPSGLYFLELRKNGQIVIEKVIKE